MRQRGQLAPTSALNIYRYGALLKGTLTALCNRCVTSPACGPVFVRVLAKLKKSSRCFPASGPAWKWIPSVLSRVNINLTCIYWTILKSKKLSQCRSDTAQTGWCYSLKCQALMWINSILGNSVFPLFLCTLSHSWWSLKSLWVFNIASYSYGNICCSFMTSIFFFFRKFCRWRMHLFVHPFFFPSLWVRWAWCSSVSLQTTLFELTGAANVAIGFLNSGFMLS